MSHSMSWQSTWPVAYPRKSGMWTVRRGTEFGRLDPESGQVKRVDPAVDRKLPGLATAMAEGELIGYRYRRRGIVATSSHFIKVVRPSRAAAVVHRHEMLEAAQRGFAVPAVLDASDDGRIALRRVPGQSLHEHLRCDSERDMTDIGRLLVALQQHRPSADLAVRRRDEVSTWLEISRRVPTAHLPTIERVAAGLASLEDKTEVVVHGDLHDKNVFCASTLGGDRLAEVGLIDLDGLALGAVEDDVVNLAVHLELRNLQGRTGHPAGSRARAVYRGYERAGGSLDADRVRLVERHTWLRLACLYQYRAASDHLVPLFLRRAGVEQRQGHRDLGPSELTGAEAE